MSEFITDVIMYKGFSIEYRVITYSYLEFEKCIKQIIVFQTQVERWVAFFVKYI